MARSVARATTARVSASFAPGGSSSVTWVWALSSAGMKPEGSSGISASEPTKNSSAPRSVRTRCFRHQCEARMYAASQRGSFSWPTMGFMM